MCEFVSVHSRAPDSRAVSRDRRRMKGCLVCMWGRSATRGARARYCNSQEHLLHAKPSWRSLEPEANQRLSIIQSLKHNAPLRGVLFGVGLDLFSFWLSVFARHHLLMFFFYQPFPSGQLKKLVRSLSEVGRRKPSVNAKSQPKSQPMSRQRTSKQPAFLHFLKNI